MPSYTFEATTTDNANRFRLVFSANEVTDEVFAYFNGSEWVVSNEGNATLQLVDMTGRVISATAINGNTTLATDTLTPGVYVMRLINGGEVKTQKVVVKNVK